MPTDAAETQSDGVVSWVDRLIRRGIAAEASDIHFEPTDEALTVRFRVDSLLSDVERLPRHIAANVCARLKVMAGLLTYRTDVPQEGVIERGRWGLECDIRVATFPTVRGERAVLRLWAGSRRALRLTDLGLADATIERLRRLLDSAQGLIVVCGPAGSGKTTTLYAVLEHLVRTRAGMSVLAVEDPVEIRLDGVTQIQIEAARGLTYGTALRSLLRQDPQVLMIGEVRDAETAQIVTEAALTGHLLLTTMHSGTPAEAIVRLLELGVPAYQVTSTLRGVLAQRLVRRLCSECGGRSASQAAGEACARCAGRGYAGRTAVGCLAEMSAELRKAILDGADAAGLSLAGGCEQIEQDAMRLVASGKTTRDELKRVLGDGVV